MDLLIAFCHLYLPTTATVSASVKWQSDEPLASRDSVLTEHDSGYFPTRLLYSYLLYSETTIR